MSKDSVVGLYEETETKFGGFLLRDFVPEDREKFHELYNLFSSSDEGRASLQFYYGHVPTEQIFRELINQNTRKRHTATILSSDDKVIGFGDYKIDSFDPERAVLSRLIIPEHQGKGIGTELICHLIKRCRQLDPRVIQMDALTLSANARAVNSLTKAMERLKVVQYPEHHGYIRFRFQVR